MLTEISGKTDDWRQIYKQIIQTFYISNDVGLKNNVVRRNKCYDVITRTFFINLFRFTHASWGAY